MSHRIAVCPVCDSTLRRDGIHDYWCSLCSRVVSFAEAIILTCAGDAR